MYYSKGEISIILRGRLRADARMVIRIFCKKIDLCDRERFDSFSAHFFPGRGLTAACARAAGIKTVA